MPVDNRTTYLDLPLADPSNIASEDVLRINESFEGLDAHAEATDTALAGKSAVGHVHPLSAVTGLIDALSGKSATNHTHALDDLTDVDTDGVTNGQALKRVGTAWQPAFLQLGDIVALEEALANKVDFNENSIVVPRGDTAARPVGVAGEALLRYNIETVSFEGWNGTMWGKVGGGAAINSAPPTPATPGDLWFSSELGVLFVYYYDGDTSQWVSTSAGLDPSLLLLKASNLSDLASAEAARLNLQLEHVIGLYSPVAQPELIIPLPAGYECFTLDYQGYLPSAPQDLSMRVSYDGVTFFAAASYIWQIQVSFGGTNVSFATSGTSFTNLSIDPPAGDVTRGKGKIEINPGSVSESFRIESRAGGYSQANASMCLYTVSGTINGGTTRAQKIRLFGASGGTFSGRFILKGVKF